MPQQIQVLYSLEVLITVLIQKSFQTMTAKIKELQASTGEPNQKYGGEPSRKFRVGHRVCGSWFDWHSISSSEAMNGKNPVNCRSCSIQGVITSVCTCNMYTI